MVDPEVKIVAVSGLIVKDKLSKIDDSHVQAFLMMPYMPEIDQTIRFYFTFTHIQRIDEAA